MSAVITPLLAVFGIMLIGTLVQKSKLLPAETDQVLNQYVYYIAFPAIMLITLAQTPINDILHWGYIAGFSGAMLTSYAITFLVSRWTNPSQNAVASMRALNATFGNTAFIGIPLMAMLFPNNQTALAAAAIASLLSVLIFAIALVSLEMIGRKQSSSAAKIISLALMHNPIVVGSMVGIVLSAMTITLPDSIALIIRQLGMTSSPCALFAIGMVLAKSAQHQTSTHIISLKQLTEISAINAIKLIFQPLVTYLIMFSLDVDPQLIAMGVILAALPTAASVYLLAQRYQTQVITSAQGILLGTLVTFITLPLLEAYLLG
ncbi:MULTISPECIES: AEC family transporter [unclassified Shewanella]|jgi:malonate transporter|uniref:AEC family transporter n=1 Tax=unclassified Shewanella TaxID=196818 RepID=UPI000C7A8476|nr:MULTISPECIES: AEC family transporter [unclassified Shewanella]PKG55555.1 transporter [Shewanella sp. GutDb-MelDb]PKG76323.1 transporter [Shewanella sp. GutCb]